MRGHADAVRLKLNKGAVMRRELYVCRRALWFATAALLFFATPAGAANITFSVMDLGTFPGALFGYTADINSLNVAVGTAFLPDYSAYHAYSRSGGIWTDLGTLGGTNSNATSINASGTVVGFSNTAGGSTHAFSYQSGVMTDIGTLPGGNMSNAYAINSTGVIVGSSDLTGGATHAFSYWAGGMTDLGTLGGSYSEAYAVNTLGDVTGYSTIAGDATQHAFLYSNGVMTDLAVLSGAFDSYGLGINAAGDVVGEVNESDGTYHGFVYSHGTWIDLGTLGGSYSDAYSISSTGTVFGRAQIAGDAEFHAFMYSDGVMTDLNNALDATGLGWELESAQLSSSGQIIGCGYFNGQPSSFLLTPSGLSAGGLSSSAPEPGSILLLIGGLGLIGAGRRRKRS